MPSAGTSSAIAKGVQSDTAALGDTAKPTVSVGVVVASCSQLWSETVRRMHAPLSCLRVNGKTVSGAET